MKKINKNEARFKRKIRIRKKIFGTSERPRLVVFRSNQHLYVQVVDDIVGRTILSVSTLRSTNKGRASSCSMVDAFQLGKEAAVLLKEQKCMQIVFDRNGYLYHGKIKAVADGVREEGIQF